MSGRDLSELQTKEWFQASTDTIQAQLTELLFQGREDLYNSLISRPLRIDGITTVRLREILEGRYFLTFIFDVRNEVGKEFTYEFVTGKQGPLLGAKVLVGIIDENFQEIKSIALCNATPFSTANSQLTCFGGFLSNGESIEECAKRELLEESGLKTIDLIPLGTVISDIGVSNCESALFFATAKMKDQRKTKQTAEPTTAVEIILLEDLKKRIQDFKDGILLSAISKSIAQGCISFPN